MKNFLRKTIDKFGEYRLYFLRGYTQYFALLISLFSHGLIIYNLLIKNIFFLSFFERFSIFFISFITLLFPLSIFIGKFDYKRGSYNKEQETLYKNSPQWVRLFEEIKDLKNEISTLKQQKNNKKL